jgi:hypothetical protein
LGGAILTESGAEFLKQSGWHMLLACAVNLRKYTHQTKIESKHKAQEMLSSVPVETKWFGSKAYDAKPDDWHGVRVGIRATSVAFKATKQHFVMPHDTT